MLGIEQVMLISKATSTLRRITFKRRFISTVRPTVLNETAAFGKHSKNRRKLKKTGFAF